jgi:hypothetical protein
MSTIVTRSGKGSPLSHVEVDANFTNLNTDKVEKTAADITGGTINSTTIGATTASTGKFSDLTDTSLTSGRVTYATTGGNLTDSANLTFNGTTLVANDITDSSLTATRVVYAGTGGNLVNASNFTYDGTNLIAGAIQNTPIGATTPAVGTFTTITGQTEVLRGTGSNLIKQSQTIGTSPWNQTGTATATINSSGTTDPLGGNTASLITSATDVGFAGNAINQLLQTATSQQVVSGVTYTFSVYIKAGTATTMQIAMRDNSTGSVPTTTLTPTSSWQRISVSMTLGSTTTSIYALLGGANGTFYAWGAQVEYGSTANAYVATTTTAVYGTPTLSFSGVSTIGLESNGSLYLQPAGTGALQAQNTTSTTAGGNARGSNAVDWQMARGTASQVATGTYSNIGGGFGNLVSGFASSIAGGYDNNPASAFSAVAGGRANLTSTNAVYSFVGGGRSNTASGVYNFMGGGFTNSGTANAAVTTQSATMNATTAVTLAASNANIKVGQYISGTSIGDDTYVAAISGTSLTLSKVASGSSTSTLSFYTAHGVVVGGGNNQATGLYSFIGGGGDAGTAANRNVASGDWSFVGGGRNNTASGGGAFVGGGGVYPVINNTYPNTASGVASAVVGGLRNTASGEASFVGGGIDNLANSRYSTVVGGTAGTTRSITGNTVFPAHEAPIAATSGVSQAALLILGTQTTDATATALRSTTAAAGTTNQVILPNNSAYLFKATVISNVTGGGNTSGWKLEGVIKRGANAASTTIVGSVTTTLLAQDAGAATWAIAATADTTNGGLRITFTGQAATTIRTVCKVETTEVTF